MNDYTDEPSMTAAAADAPAAAASEQPSNDEGWDWAILEIFGHRRHVGRIREEERFGAKMPGSIFRPPIPKARWPRSGRRISTAAARSFR